ncbi:hypothetical protein XM53_18320 [Roseovarius atlanticus]|uniref:Tail tape measure protein n=1 Tax=Roseovarius atlanticus TaxID=1641875 RepID=A0A0T5NPX6_9RHOB|nr:hypothetical protein [Roseovarius atlanticus]KRS11035.1 hypothetical protein XM53_18320 [Roseovarius atlanticus]
MNDTNLPGLIVPVEARITQLEKGLARANRAQRRAAQNMERRAKQSADRMSASYARAGTAAAAAFKRVALPIAAGVASAGTVRAIGQTTKAVAKLGDEAERAGMKVEPFQEWKYIAEQNRIGIDQMVDGFKELNLRADEFVVTGKGPAAEAFARLGFGAEDLREKLKDPSALMLEIIERLRRLDTAGRIRVADEIFGGSAGERFVELIDQGAAGLRETIDRAHELGFVMDESMVRRADELDRKFAELTTRVSSFGKRVAVEIADGIASVAGLRESLDSLFESEAQGRAILGDQVFDTLDQNAAALEKNKGEVIDLRETYAELFREVNAMTQPGGIRVFEIDNEDARYALADIIAGIDDVTRKFDSGGMSAEDFTGEMTDLADEADAVRKELAAVDGARFQNAIANIGNLVDAIRTATVEAVKLRNNLPGGYVSSGRGDGSAEVEARRRQDNGQATPQAPTTSLRPRAAPPMLHENVTTPSRSSGGGGGGGRTADDYARTATAIRDETRALELEAAALAAVALAGRDLAPAIEQARREAELLHEAQRQGVTITPQLRAEIKAAAAAYAKADQSVAQAEERLQAFETAKERMRGAAENAFVGLITGAHDFRSALQMIIADLAQMAASRVFKSIFTGAGGGLFGGLLSGLGFSEGGFTGPGGKFQPAGIVHKGEYVMSKQATNRIGVGNLEALHSAAKKGYAAGGLVGGTARLRTASQGRSESPAMAGQVININAPVTVEAGAGTPEQNNDLAKKMAREMENTMRGVVVDELRRQHRPGNMMNNGRNR